MHVKRLELGELRTNCYVIWDDAGDAAVIDPAFDADAIKDFLVSAGLSLKKILLTHAHFDHIMAADALRGNGAVLCVHTDDEPMLYDPSLNCSQIFFGKGFTVKKADVLLCDGDSVFVGNEELKVIHTPGHTDGSVCYATDEHIFTGDTLFAGSVGRCDLPQGDYVKLMHSLKKLKSLEKNYSVYAGHGEPTFLDYEKKHNLYMKTLR